MGIHNQPCDSLSLGPENWWISKLKPILLGIMDSMRYIQTTPTIFFKGWWFGPIAEPSKLSPTCRQTHRCWTPDTSIGPVLNNFWPKVVDSQISGFELRIKPWAILGWHIVFHSFYCVHVYRVYTSYFDGLASAYWTSLWKPGDRNKWFKWWFTYRK